MKKPFLLSLIFCPAIANAQSLGCYVDAGTLNAYGGLFLCGLSQAHPNISSCGNDFAGDVAAFGKSLAESCRDERKLVNDFADSLNQCNASLNKASASQSFYFTQWSACGDTTNQINGAIGYWQGLANYWNTLYSQQTSRLNAALAKCGKKCRGL